MAALYFLADCPMCNSNEITFDTIEAHKPDREEEAWQGASCDECGASWTIIYVFDRAAYVNPGPEYK